MEYIKDNAGRQIGIIRESPGVTYIINSQGMQVGQYNHASNTTFDKNGMPIGRGNQLMRLL